MMKTLAIASLAVVSAAASASTLVYVPVNPSFGGNPGNGVVLLNEAQAENNTRDPAASSSLDALGNSRTGNTALDIFNLALQNAVLSRLTSALVSNIIGPTGQLTPGTIQTSSFDITVADIGNGRLSITTTDRTTGQSTVFQIASSSQ